MKSKPFLIVCLITALSLSAQTYNYEQAVVAYRAKEYEKAMDFFNHDLADNPKHADSYCYRALIYNTHHKNSEALSDINNALKYEAPKTGAFFPQTNFEVKNVYFKKMIALMVY
jgi:tetratricopeptide (TPR) repeat protein